MSFLLTLKTCFDNIYSVNESGRLAQLVRASALQAEGLRFESVNAHHFFCRHSVTGSATDL